MKTNMKIRREDVEKSDEDQNVESCKLERLKMTAAYGPAGQAEAWVEGITAQQADVACAAVRKPKRSVLGRRPRLATGRS
jgi:hypothetical protein